MCRCNEATAAYLEGTPAQRGLFAVTGKTESVLASACNAAVLALGLLADLLIKLLFFLATCWQMMMQLLDSVLEEHCKIFGVIPRACMVL